MAHDATCPSHIKARPVVAMDRHGEMNKALALLAAYRRFVEAKKGCNQFTLDDATHKFWREAKEAVGE